jgi:hypothetical protein
MNRKWLLLGIPALLLSAICSGGMIGGVINQAVAEPGPPGAIGRHGAQGAPGARGEKGLAGSRGPSGLIGPQGKKGDTGDVGPEGPKYAVKTLLTFNGSGIKKSAKFTTGDDWTLKYTYNCSGFGGSGNFIVDLYTNGSPEDVLVNELGPAGTSTSPVYSAGEHWLDVNSECNWTVSVEG